MADYTCKPVSGPIDAVVKIPGSKSITNRALVASALADGTSLLTGVLFAQDTRCMIGALRELGIAVTTDQRDKTVEVTGCRGHLPATEARLNCENSGTTIRFCTAMAALGRGRYELDGIERMRARPIAELTDVLGAMGTGIEYLGSEGFPPIRVYASGLAGGTVRFVSPASSQFVSALLLAAPYAARDVMIEVVGGVTSRPYLRATTAVMDAFGATVVEQYDQDEARFIVAAPQRYQAAVYAIEPDASSASYFLAAAAITGGRVTIDGLSKSSVQGDVGFADVLVRMGCRVEADPAGLTLIGPKRGRRLVGIDVDLNDMPDVAQTLAVVALFAEGPTAIRNVANLRIKETDRIAALSAELTRLGARVEERADGLTVDPPKQLQPARVETYDDHRMAMSFALAGLRARGVVIVDADCCGKTFPDFFDCWDRMAATAR